MSEWERFGSTGYRTEKESEAMMSRIKQKPVSVMDEVAFLRRQIAENALWSEQEREEQATVITAIEGKRKADALKALQDLRTGRTAQGSVSRLASFANLTYSHLKHGR
jgi:hypothetical protein